MIISFLGSLDLPEAQIDLWVAAGAAAPDPEQYVEDHIRDWIRNAQATDPALVTWRHVPVDVFYLHRLRIYVTFGSPSVDWETAVETC